jgi:hypothetical protein
MKIDIEGLISQSPSSGTGRVREPRLMLQGEKVRENRWRCRYSSAYVVAAFMFLREDDLTVCETGAEGYHAN